jgi:hypothetical protein
MEDAVIVDRQVHDRGVSRVVDVARDRRQSAAKGVEVRVRRRPR